MQRDLNGSGFGTARRSSIALIRARDARQAGSRPFEDPLLTRVRPGVYVERSAWDPLPPWDRYFVRVQAFAAQHPRAIFSHESAAALAGLPLFGEPREIHVHDVHRSRSRRFGDVCVHTSMREPSITRSDGGLLMTHPAETVIALARVLPAAFALAVADAAISPSAEMDVDLDRLRSTFDDHLDSRGRRTVEWVLSRARPLSESVGESVSRAVIEWLGYAEPELQTVFRTDGREDRADFFWPARSVIGEFDGMAKYGLPADGMPVDPVARVVAEKRREDRLRRRVRTVARWDWTMVMAPRRLDAVLRDAGLEPIRPRQSGYLATLSRHPRSGSVR